MSAAPESAPVAAPVPAPVPVRANLAIELFVADIARAPVRQVWPQGLVTLAVQVALFLALDLTFWGWLAVNWAFGIN